MPGLLRHGDIYNLAERQGGFFTARRPVKLGGRATRTPTT